MKKTLWVVTVLWVDSFVTAGWADTMPAPAECETTGYLIHRDKKTMVVAQSISHSSGAACSLIAIPRSCVTNITYHRKVRV